MAKYYNTSIKNLVFRLRKFKDILEQELENEISSNGNVVVDMIANEQLYEQGIEGRNIKISSYAPYKYRTVQNKIKKGQPYDRVTLRDTGKFHASLRLVHDDKGFYVISEDSKASELLEKYGPTIFRLTNENLKTLLNSYVRPLLSRKLKNFIQHGG